MSDPATRLVRVASQVGAHAPQAVLASLACGIVLAPASPASLLLIPVSILAAALLGLPRLGVLCGAALAIGAVIGAERLASIDAGGAALDHGDQVAGRAEVVAPARDGAFGASVEVELTSGAAAGARVVARLPRDSPTIPLGIGDELELRGVFERIRSDPAAEFDYGAFLRRRGVAGELDAEEVRTTGGRRAGLVGMLDAGRARADGALRAGLSPAAAELARGMVLGQDERIDESTWADYRDSGLAHLLAVSGLNVMLLVALAAPLLALAGVPRPARVVVLIALVALYVPLAGAGPSIQRAGVMGAASLAALQLSRPASRWYALLLAAVVTLVLNPRAWADPGWQLSFAAVLGILLAARPLAQALPGVPRALADGLAVTVAATLATAPLLAHHFGTVSLAAIPANLAALPLVAPIMWLGMLRVGLGQVDWAAGPARELGRLVNRALGPPLEWLLDGLTGVAALFADLPGSQVAIPLGHPAAVLAAYLAIALACWRAVDLHRRHDTRLRSAEAYVRRLPRARRAALAFAGTLIAMLVLARGLAPPGHPDALTVTFIDVGQGDATLIQHPDGSNVLFDGGPPEGGVARLLRRAGVRHLSALVMTHASRDHHGGLQPVVERYPVDLLLDGGDGTRDASFRAVVEAAVDRGARHVRAVAPLTVRVGAITVRVLSPTVRAAGPPPKDPNPRAVVSLVSAGGLDLLLSGDAESPSLLPLSLPDVELMKLPHHGSADEGLPDLLDRLQPELAAITVGENTYGHPAPSTLAALAGAGVPAWRTDLNGSIRVSVEQGRLRVRSERGAVARPP